MHGLITIKNSKAVPFYSRLLKQNASEFLEILKLMFSHTTSTVMSTAGSNLQKQYINPLGAGKSLMTNPIQSLVHHSYSTIYNKETF